MTWITGQEILARPGWGLEKDLIDAYGEWGLSPFRQIDGARMTCNSKCFNCTRANKDYMPGRPDEHGGPCLPLQWSSLRQDTGGLCIPRFAPNYAKAKELDPELAEYFFQDGEFTLDAGCVSITNPRLLRFLTAMIGEDAVEHMVLENACDKHERMSPLYMADRLKAARFRLQDVTAHEDRHGIGQDGAGQGKGQNQESGKTRLHFACAEDFVAYHRGLGVHELHELARLVDAYFTETARLTDIQLGALLPAKGTEASKPEGCRSQGKRLRKRYATSK